MDVLIIDYVILNLGTLEHSSSQGGISRTYTGDIYITNVFATQAEVSKPRTLFF